MHWGSQASEAETPRLNDLVPAAINAAIPGKELVPNKDVPCNCLFALAKTYPRPFKVNPPPPGTKNYLRQKLKNYFLGDCDNFTSSITQKNSLRIIVSAVTK